jgi:hypothetical protein
MTLKHAAMLGAAIVGVVAAWRDSGFVALMALWLIWCVFSHDPRPSAEGDEA